MATKKPNSRLTSEISQISKEFLKFRVSPWRFQKDKGTMLIAGSGNADRNAKFNKIRKH